MKQTSEEAFETAIERSLLQSGDFAKIDSKQFDTELAIFPETALAFIRDTQPKT